MKQTPPATPYVYNDHVADAVAELKQTVPPIPGFDQQTTARHTMFEMHPTVHHMLWAWIYEGDTGRLWILKGDAWRVTYVPSAEDLAKQLLSESCPFPNKTPEKGFGLMTDAAWESDWNRRNAA